MMQLLAVGIGGFMGSIFRYLLSTYINTRFGQAFTFLGTLSVNLLGCLLIGIFIGFFNHKVEMAPEIKLLLVTGLLGGFTTFSTFSLESFHFYKAGDYGFLALNLGTNFVFGFLFVGLGLWFSESLFS
ncbi:MAG: fluoride efflux transporter CrcB [SAR324 cluster bacterium]|nr:fluoride efflux transporter CrcB [SAR324 cluster bacterium]